MNHPRDDFENWDEVDGEMSPADKVAALVAGDLDPAESAEIEAAIAADPELQAERDYWRQVQGALPEAAKPRDVPIPGPGLAEVLRRRMGVDAAPQKAPQTAGPKVVPLSAAFGWAVAAAACVALAILAVPWSENHKGTVIYDDAGVAHVMTSAEAEKGPASWHTVSLNATKAPDHSMVPVNQNQLRPWIGMWTKPVDLKDFDQSSGLLIVRVASGSPASEAGLRPGDVLLELGENHRVFSKKCIPHAIDDKTPQTSVRIRYWRGDGQGVRLGDLVLGSCWE